MYTFVPLVFAMWLAQAPPVQSADIQSVSWMAGQWVGLDPAEVSEEIWLPPAADSMVGMWRWARDGKVQLYELLTISREGTGLALRLRHFRPDLRALEEKDKPYVLPLIKSAPNEAVFEGIGSDGGPLRISYKRVGGDRLEATVEKGTGKETYAYRLRR